MEKNVPRHVPLVAVTRGEALESVHYGSVAVVGASGQLVAAVGDTDFPVFTRSTLKPFQALPFVIDGGPEHFGFSPGQVALMCASHSGEPRHVSAVADMLRRIGCDETQLLCGTHMPFFYDAVGVPPPPGMVPGPLHHNCSGKHAGFLAWCRLHGQPVENYVDPAHPLQQEIRRRLAELADCREEQMPMGIDGCSAPNYALGLGKLAGIYAQLAVSDEKNGYGKALGSLFRAMTDHPEMVSGEARSDGLLMEMAPGDWVAKGGAEGVQALGIRSRGLGLAIKIADGGSRALQVALASAGAQLGLLPKGDEPSQRPWPETEIRNHAGRLTGRLLPIFQLQ